MAFTFGNAGLAPSKNMWRVFIGRYSGAIESKDFMFLTFYIFKHLMPPLKIIYKILLVVFLTLPRQL